MRIGKELMKGSTATLILTLLARRPMYGYELSKELEQDSGGLFALKEGTLYPILHQLEADGNVEAEWSEEDGRKRKYYRVTAAGKRLLTEKTAEWRLFRSTVDRVLGEETP